MARYSEKFKYSIIQRMMPPKSESVSSISRETGLPEGTLYSWKKQARVKGIAVPGGEPESERWSTQDKFLIVVETASLSEIELAEYCRRDSGLSFVLAGAVLNQVTAGQFLYLSRVIESVDIPGFTDKSCSRNQSDSLAPQQFDCVRHLK